MVGRRQQAKGAQGMKSEVLRLVSYSQQWRTPFAIPASFADSTCTGPRRTGAHPAQLGAFRVEFAGVSCMSCLFSALGQVSPHPPHPGAHGGVRRTVRYV